MHEIKVYNFQLIGELKGFPHQVVEKMIERSIPTHPGWTIKQILKMFQQGKMGGFTWYSSVEGDYFWRRVILSGDFDLFFRKYPKS